MAQLLQVLHEDQLFQIGLIKSEQSDLIEVIKICKSSGAPETAIRNEYNILSELDIKGVRKASRLEFFQGASALFLEYIPGKNLADYLFAEKIHVKECLDIAVKLIKVIDGIHRAKIIHKNLNPLNILISDLDQEVYVLNFEAAGPMAHKIDSNLPVRRLGGALPYISPEQTGRINFAVDFRSDYYSYGIILYQLFTGELPCNSKDPVEQVHFHLALNPTAPVVLNPNIPNPVSDIILKLLSKNPSERYQSAGGILNDLLECQKQFNNAGVVQDFEIGQKDKSALLRLNDGIYGREAEVKSMLARFEQAAVGKAQLMLIGGYSGIGKTALVREIVKPVFLRGGNFVSGKFDQFQRDVPYSAVIRALDTWVDITLAENDADLAEWKQVLQEALGDNGAILANLVPKMEKLIGKQAELPDLGSVMAQSRFNQTIINFFKAIARPDVPLVLFLDDMQWADFASLELLKLLFKSESELEHSLIICSYRDNEVDDVHPFRLAVREVKRAGAQVSDIILGPLGNDTLAAMLSDILHLKKEETNELSALFQKKTQGNPFYIKAFLDFLKDQEFIRFSYELGRWTWDVDQIRNQAVTENVADLLSNSFSAFSTDTMDILRVAACIGNRFKLQHLSAYLEKHAGEILEKLIEPVGKELILPIEGRQDYIFSSRQADEYMPDVQFRFGHDKIRYHLYDTIPESEKKRIHLKLGRLLVHEMAHNNSEAQIFEAAAQFNNGLELIETDAERLNITELNLRAGIKAKNAGAYMEALDHLQTGLKLLPENSWKRNYQLTLGLYLEAAETAYSSRRFDLLIQCTDAVFQQAQNPADKAQAVKAKTLYTVGVLEDMGGAVTMIVQVLKELGVHIGEHANNLTVLKELLKVRLALSGKTDKYILDLPAVSAEKSRAALQLLSQLMPATYRIRPLVYVVAVMESILLELREGHTGESAFHFAVYGVITWAAFKDLKAAQRFYGISLELQSRFGSNRELPQTYGALYAGMGYLVEPALDLLPKYEKAHSIARENGDHYWAAVHLALCASRRFWLGVDLQTQWEAVTREERLLVNYDHKTYYEWLNMTRQALACLIGHAPNPAELNGNLVNGQLSLKEIIDGDDTSVGAFFYVIKYYLACMFDDVEPAQRYAQHANAYMRDAGTELTIMVYRFYHAVFNAVQIAEGSLQGNLKTSIKQGAFVKKMALACPMNFDGKPQLIDAAIAWAKSDHALAEKLFMESAEKLQKTGFIQEKALAYELAGRHALQRGLNAIAGYYLNQACRDYEAWGASSKSKQLNTRYPEVLAAFRSRTDNKSESAISINMLGENIDFLSILKASKAMLEEIALDKLLEKLMRIVLENGGATRCVLLLENQGRWTVEGTADTQTGSIDIAVLQGIPASEYSAIPDAVVKFVIRTKETVVLDHAAVEGNYTYDLYIISHKINSVSAVLGLK